MKKEGGIVNNKNNNLSFYLLKAFLPLTFLLLFLTNFASAQFFDRYGYGYGGYGSLSLSDILSRFDPQTVFYVLLFFILFTILTLALSRVGLFRDYRGQPNSAAAGVVAFSISAMIVYYLYRTGYNIESFFYDIGFAGGDAFSLLVVVVLLVAAFFIIKNYHFSGFLMILGTFIMIVAGFTNIIYERGTALIIGLIIGGIGMLMRRGIRGRDIKTH